MEYIIVKARPSSWESGVVVAVTENGIKILCKFERSTIEGEESFAKRIVGHTVYLTDEEEAIIKKYPDSYRLPERWLKQPSDLKYRHNPGYGMTTQQEVRDNFWDTFPDLRVYYRAGKRQNEYNADIRMTFVGYVDLLARDGIISESLAQRVTL